MKRAIQTIASRLKDTLSSWPTVECIASGEAAEQDLLSPYFALILDVYYRDGIPAAKARSEGFGAVGAFETSGAHAKDRFLVDGLPVRVEYKEMGRIEEDLESPALAERLVETGTYPLHRLATWKILYEQGDWIQAVRRSLLAIDEGVWTALGGVAKQRMEHCLGDFGAAVWQGDEYFAATSFAGFLKQAACALFAVNRRFEPSGRFITRSLASLPILPDSFVGNWESILRPGEAPERRFEIARFIARSVLDL